MADCGNEQGNSSYLFRGVNYGIGDTQCLKYVLGGLDRTYHICMLC